MIPPISPHGHCSIALSLHNGSTPPIILLPLLHCRILIFSPVAACLASMIAGDEPTPIVFPHPTSNEYNDEGYVGISILVTKFEMM